MLDREEQADYEAWKVRKLEGQIDLSVEAYNIEMEAPALAWEAGWDDAQGVYPKERSQNPYRAKGMNGERK